MAWLFMTSFVSPRHDQLSAESEGLYPHRPGQQKLTDLGDRLLQESEGKSKLF